MTGPAGPDPDGPQEIRVVVPADLAEWWDTLAVHDPWNEGDPAGRLRHLRTVEAHWLGPGGAPWRLA